MDAIKLKTSKQSLKVVIDNKNWCDVFFAEDSKERRLGAQSLDRILPNLLISFLPLENRNFFVYSEQEMFTIANLVDAHSVIAGKINNNKELELIYLDTDGNIFPMMILNEETKIQWIKDICFYLTDKKHRE